MNRRIAHRGTSPGPSRQKGVALLVVLMLSMVAMTAGLITAKGSETELQIAHNNAQGQRAMAIAEAGLNHAIALINNNGLRFTDELKGTGGVATLGNSTDVGGQTYRFRTFGGNGTTDGYLVRLSDNFDETTGTDAPLVDTDNIINVISRGRFGNAERTLTAQIGLGPPPPMCAIVTQGNLQISGNPTISGAQGCVHTNANLVISGNPNLAQGATSSGTMAIGGGSVVASGVTLSATVLGDCGGGRSVRDCFILANQNRSPVTIPSVRPFRFGPFQIEMWKEVMNHPKGYRLDVNGRVYAGPGYIINPAASESTRGRNGLPADAWICNEGSGTLGLPGYVAPDCTGGQDLGDGVGQSWNGYSHGIDSSAIPGAKWTVGGSVIDGVLFVEGHVQISANPGSAINPWRVTIISLNSVGMSGNPFMQPFESTATSKLRNILFISGNDVELNGNGSADQFNNAAIFAHQQIKLSGNPTLNGFLVAEDADQDSRVDFGVVESRTWAGDPARHCHSKEDYLCDPNGNSVSGNATIRFDVLDTVGFPANVRRISFAEIR